MPASTPAQSPLVSFLRDRWISIVLVILTAVFILQNRNRADINLFWMHVSMPLWLVLFLIAAIGVVIGYLVSRRRYR